MKIQKHLTFLVLFLYVLLIYFSPPRYINKPKFIILQIVRLPLSVASRISSNINYLFHSKDLINQNKLLQKTVDNLTTELSRNNEIEKENLRLRKLVQFKKASSFKLIPAKVIGRDSSNLSDSIIINVGSNKSVKEDTVVVSKAGLIGRVYNSFSAMSKVMLITDANSRISAIISRSRQFGMLYGTSAGLCILKHLPLDVDLILGDEVITSGFSDIYPKGIAVGKVVRIVKEPRGLTLSAIIQPHVDMGRLEEVLCIE